MNSDIDLIYELSPMQQAMLFHSLYAPGSGVYVLQQSLRLTGRLDLAAFERAWRRIIDRHDILRTAFFWEGLEKPVQVVYRQAALEVTRESWRGLDPAEQETRLARFLDADRERGFDAAAAPLMRVSLFELAVDAYQVVWTQHHLVVDGWSQGQVLRELFAAYTAFAAGGEPRLPPVRGYREYISWLQRQDGEQAEAFWRKALAGFDSPTWIAGADGKAEGPAWQESGERELVLPAAATGALGEAARRHALTLNTLVQGAWALFLARETGAAEVVFGTTVAGRPPGLPGVESIVGPFINTLPLRVAVRPEMRLWEWLTDLQARQVEMRRFEHSSLVEVQRWSALPAGVRLFDHIVVFENQSLVGDHADAQVPGLAIAVEGGSSLTNYPLNLIVLPGSALTLLIRYDTSRFTPARVARMLARLERLLAAFAANEDLTLEDVPQLGAAERHQIVVEWGSPAGGEGRQTLHARFEQQARRTPSAVAVTFEGSSLTYAELNRRANQLAWHLRALGVGPEDRVGLRGERSPELLEGILGILKAGAAYVPLDPRYPSERLAYMAEDAGVRVVVGTEPVALDRLRSHLESLPADDPPACVDAASLAYVIYTSGSTGRPKGVQVTHGNVVRLFDATADWFGFTASDVWTLFHSYSFDFSVWEIWGALLHGGRVVVVPWAVSRAPEQFLALLAAEKVTVLNQTPSAFAQLARIAVDRLPASLRLVIFGGEALDIGSLAPWFARHGDAWPRLVNMYGITETTVHVTYRPLASEDTGQDTGRRSIIGRHIPDLGLYLLDPSLQPVPIGVAGEIAVGGAGLARGYLGSPDLTAERFVPDGLSGRRGARLYRSGDLGRFLPDGDVEYFGRIDHQVKIRGFRIELGEIEAVLAGHPAVRECVVLARRDGGMAEDARLVAYLVAAGPAAPPAPEELRAHLRATLPDHMVPAALVWLPALPLTQNGKVDRKALPAPEGLRAAESEYVAPADAVEERLAAIWGEVLRVERVGAHNDFFALGGHSLLATQVASRLREAFGLEIPLRGLFEAPTVAGLAEVIDEQAEQAAAAIDLTALLDDLDHLSDDEAAARLDDPRAVRSMARARSLEAATATALVEEELPLAPVALPRQAGDNRFPLSFAQQRLWFLDQLEPDSPAYNVPLPVRLRGELPTARLARIAAELVDRHETLRTTFLESDGEPVQVVHAAPEPAPALGLIDLSGLPDAVRELAARRIVELDAWQPFDLRRGPLLRLRLLRLAPRDHMLLLTLHHIVSDGWSMRVLLREVAALFAAARLPELEFQYADFAVWQRAWLQGRVLDEQLAFWKRQLAGAPSVLEMPTDRPRPAVQTFRGAAVQRALPPAVAAAVRELCRREDVTPFMALLATWALLLGRHAGQKEVVIGTPVAGRHVRGTEHLIGFFANTLVLRVDLRGSEGDIASFKTLLAHSRRVALDAFSHQDIPFERLVEELVPARDLSRSPLFQVMFVLHAAGGEGWRIPGLAVEPVPLDGVTAKFDLLLTVVDLVDGGFACTLEYSTDLFAAERMERLLENFTVLLAGAAAEPEIPLLELPMIGAAERQRLLADWNSDRAAFPRVCVHWPVEEQAERTPDVLAVVWSRVENDGTVTADATGGLTYSELNRRANQLAHHLLSFGGVSGIGADDRVAICLERSVAMTVAVLAVLKAGAAYVPLDPDYPADRVAYMLDDSRSKALITTSGLAAGLPATAAHRVLLDADAAAIAAESEENPRVPLAPENLIYVIYTSGSTGRPKGVAMPHGVLSNLIHWQRGASSAGVGTRTLQFASLSFDASFHEMFSTWWTGGTLVGVTQETRRDPVALSAVLRAWEVGRVFLPFVALQALAEAIDLGAPPPVSLREIFTAGEQLRITRQIRAWLDGSNAWLENQYGPSEGHVVTAHRLRPPATAWSSLPPIGRPLPNVPVYLLDGSLAPVPQGAVGQLYFGGAQVVRGYLGRPELTAETHIPDPFSAEPGARLYVTGDQARYLEGCLEDGAIQFLGRADQQVKIRGFRVEPGEVESALARHPAVRAAVVVVRGLDSDGPADKALVAYYVADAPLAAAELTAFLKKDLPEYMLPAILVRLDALPLTPSGKVDRKALPAPVPVAEELQAHAAPADPVEEILAALWAEVLHRERIGVHEDFFALGGHSLLATQVVSRIRRTLGVELPLRQLFETPTVAGYARAVRAAGRTEKLAPPIVPVSRDRTLPLSFAQQRLWLIDQLEPGSAAYNLPLAVRLSGRLSPPLPAAGGAMEEGGQGGEVLLETIFAGIVRRHEVLRTTFAPGETGPVQIIAEPWRPAVRFIDLSRLSDREARARKLALDEARQPFDLAQGPLFRLVLLRLAEDEHILLLTMHHIITDGWSMGVMLREIAALHAGTPLPELAVQYADFAVWQRSWLSGAVLDEQITFWKERLAGAPHVLELPTDRPRPARQTVHGAAHPVNLPPALAETVRALSRQHGATPFMALLAAWGLLLARHSGQDDVLIGTPIAGRNHREIEDLIGFFVNTLVLRVDLRAGGDGDITFAGLLTRLRATALDAYAHQDLPFERLVEELVPERDLSRSPLFQALFVLQNAPVGELRLPGLSLAPLEIESGVTKFDLTLALGETREGISGVLEHNTDLFDASTAARLIARFAALLAAAAGEPERGLRDLPLLLPAERQQALLEWNDAATVYPREASVAELFAAVARAYPENLAILTGKGGEEWTYARLDAASDRLARRLRALGVGAHGETAVGIAMERSPELIVGTLAILKAGGFYVPLDPEYPDERIAFMLADTGAEIVLVHERTRERMAGRGRLVEVDSKEGEESGNHWNRLPAAGLAYVIYTSGSTGRPKGVAVPQRAVVRLVRATNYVALGPGDRLGHVANISFDAATYEIWGALLTGAAVVVIPREVVLAPGEFAEWLRAFGVSSMFLTSALFTKMAREAPGAFATLRELLVGGEAVDPAAARTVLADRPPQRLLNGYGPTESTTFAAWHPIRAVPAGAASIPIGRPLANTALYVLVRDNAVVPPGAVGELCIGGDGLARGYLNRPELTAERFVPHPWSAGERLYRTGDRVRQRPDGAVEYLGRLDDQVKIRGFRIEPGEIEAALAVLPGVNECAVIARNDGGKETRLVAYVVPAAGIDLTEERLRADLKRTLPDYMLPAAIVFLDALPLTANGKLDRRALPEPGRSRSAAPLAPVPPADEIERQLVLIWEEVLDVHPVGVEDDFFALGGHSLLATLVMSRLRAVLGVNLPIRQLFEHPTVAGLAAAVRSAGTQASLEAPPIVPLPETARSGDLPLSFAQQRLWFLDQLDPGSAAYNIPLAVRLTGELAVDLLERIFREVIRRHEALRTTFALRDGRPVQVIAPVALRVEVPLLDLSEAPAEEREDWARRLALQEARRPFNLERGPLLRLGLIRLAEREHLLLITFHHIVSDGWSIGVLLREIAALYSRSPLPELPVQYADFASWQRDWLAGEVLERQLGYWRNRLSGAPALLELPTDRPRPPVQTFRGASAGVSLPPALSAAVQALCQKEGATPFMALLAAWAVLLGRHAGQDDVLIGTPIAGRNRREIEDLIGFFVNTLVIRVRLEDTGADGPSFAALLAQVRETALGAFTHQDLPFERLVEELVPERQLSHSPLFQAAFALQNAPGERLSVPDLSLTLEGLENEIAKFDLSLILWQEGAGFAGALEHNTDLFDATTAERLVARFTALLEAAIGDPGVAIGELPLLAEAERHQALVEWNDTAGSQSPDLLMHQLFAAQAEARPDDLAAVWEENAWTYRELAERAHRLASFLRHLDVKRGTAVGVWMDRSLDMLAGVLGILEAGGTYVPLDAAWPADRVETILAGASAPVILCSRRTLPTVEKLRWGLPQLGDAICLDVETTEPAPETVDTAAIRSLFDFVSDRATDRVTAGGFVSRRTGLPFLAAEVDEYRDRVLSLAEPWLRPGARVLEVGCGSGLILWEMARRVERAVGLDPSEHTQERNREHARAAGIDNVELPTGFADEIGERFAPGSFDLVLLASTVQFFPGPRYLEKVVADALALLAPGGALLLADVIDARKDPAAPNTATNTLTLDEELFHDLGRAEIHHRTEGFANELGERYDVILQAGETKRKKRTWTGWHVERSPASRLPAVSAPGDIAYVIHTSGSTGLPKGIAVQHAPAVNLIHWINRTLGVGPGDRLLFITSLAFDLSVWDIFGMLAAGGTVHIASEAAIREPAELVRLLAAEPITIWDSAPAALQQLAPLFLPGTPRRLRLAMLSGDWIPVPLPDQVRAAFPGCRVISLGGATEATVWSNWYPVEEVDPRWPSIPYGRPIGNARYHALDAELRPSPIGVPGDLYIGGGCLCVGYTGQPALTAAAFVPDPFSGNSGEPGARLYRTGDRVRFFADGNLEFLGRVDRQVKLRGFRIELGEIETALAAHPAVSECVVLVREDTPGVRLLVAYVVPAPTVLSAPSVSGNLRAFLAERLPGFMVPAAFVLLDALPLTPNGKVDRRALPEPDRARGGEAYVEPSDPVEVLLAGIWADVLGLGRVGRHDNFFALGGHSMLATQVVAQIRAQLHMELPLRALFDARTLAELAVAVRGKETDKDIKDCKDIKDEQQEQEETELGIAVAPAIRPWRAVSARLAGLSAEKRQLLDAVLQEQRAAPAGGIPPRADRSAPVPLSFSQERMWFFHQLDPLSAVYNVFLGVRLTGDLRSEVLAAAFAQLIRRHQVLATRYETAGSQTVQVVDGLGPFPLPRIDLAGLSAERRTVELDRLQAEESGRPFDLVHGPVLRARLVHQEPGEHALLLTIHHIAVDGWSLGILLPELAALYAALMEGRPSPLPAPRLQVADFAVWQRRWLRGDALEAQLAYWRRQLAPPLPLLSLPTDRPRGATAQDFRLATETLAFPAALTADLHALGNGRGASLFMVLLAGFAAVLQRSGGGERILVGTPVAGRNRRELEELAGMFLNTLVLRVDLEGDPDAGSLLQSTAQTALEAFAHQDLPLETLLQELRIERGPRGPFQAMLLLQNLQPLHVEVPGLTLTSLGAERQVDLGTAVFEIGLTIEEHGGALQASLSYNAMLFDAATLHRLLLHLRTLLAGAAADPATRLSSLPLLAPEEQWQVAAWNGMETGGAAGEGGDPVTLFAAVATRAPLAEAVRHPGSSITYAELDLRSRALAERLRAAGVGPEVPVAIFLERSPGLIAALLGVLRAGGVYAPLDPALPAERLAWILADLKPAVLVTEAALAGRIPWDGKILFVEGELPSPGSSRHALPAPDPAQAAYVIYTSGSTGRPKGVVVSRGALAGFVAAATKLYGITAEDRVLQLAAIGFDASVEEIYPCLATGGTLVLRTDEMAGTIDGFLRGCAEQGITVLDLPTAFWHELVVSPELERRGLPPSVRLVILGGERPLPERVAAWLHQSDPRVRLFNTYGPTEATVVATAAELPPALADEAWREVPMGRPLAGARAHVLDSAARQVPVGVPGELYLGGVGVARGYLGRPDLTAERFVPDPFSGLGARLYRTGDLARRRVDGSLEFAGRADAQVKIRGFRVEPGEIESMLAAAPQVAECAVVARADSLRGGDLRLVAYVVPAAGTKPAAADLRAFLDSRLPAWMVPAAFVILPALPRTANGKIDRRALPAPEGAGPDHERPYVAPRNDVEEIVAEIWREALGLERISVHDSFFELGGHSLLLLQVMRRLREELDVEIPLRSVYEERTVEALALKIEELLIEEISRVP